MLRTRRSLATPLLIGFLAITSASCAATTGTPTELAQTTTASTTALPAAVNPATTMVSGATAAAATPATPTRAPSTTAGPTLRTLGELDDLDEDGQRDTVCATADLGGGLVVSTLCNDALRPTPEGDVIPTVASVLNLPSPTRWSDVANVDATIRVARTTAGRQVVIYILGSDTLFDSGQSAVRTTAQPPIAAIVASVAKRFPGAAVDVRGAADSVGSATADQTLSEQRAAAIGDALRMAGLTSVVTTRGLGAAVPAALERKPDGSVSEAGQQVNRRVEIVVTIGAATLPANVIDAAKQLAEVDPSYDICGRLPSMDAIATEVGLAFTIAKPDIDPLGNAWKCDVTGNSTTAVLFERLALEPGRELVAAMRTGGQVVDYQDASLAAAVAYVNTISVEHKGYIFTVSIVDPFAKLNDPTLLTHAGRLLAAWLAKL